jgi:hypothetical protein
VGSALNQASEASSRNRPPNDACSTRGARDAGRHSSHGLGCAEPEERPTQLQLPPTLLLR